ncbi:hypothetical protein Tco_0593962 [Tanacetum coccineum]
MANLKYSDKHNMVAFLKKPNESVVFTEVVDFLKGTSLRYALTYNPTIYDSLVKQFWQTATVRTLANGTQQLVASIDSKEYTITKASVRSKLQLADATGIHNLSDVEIYVGLATLCPKFGGWDQFGSTVATALICLSSNRGIHEREVTRFWLLLTKALGGLKKKEKEISPTIWEAAKTLSKMLKQKINTAEKKLTTGEGKAPMTEENIQATHKTKEQLRQEEAGLEEAIKLQAQLDEEVAKQIHLDKMIAKRMAKKEALSEKQKKRKSQVKKLKFEEIKEEFDKLVQQIDTFVPINPEATKEKLKRYGEEL